MLEQEPSFSLNVLDLPDFVRTLRSFDPAQYGPENVGRLLAGVPAGVDALKPYMSFRPEGYTRNLIYKNENFEVAVLCWDAAAVSPVHDHAAQRCWFTTLEGAFDVENFGRAVGGHAEGYARLYHIDTVRGLRNGQPDYRFGDNDVHRVLVTPGEGRAVSLHVYARPITSCLIYDLDARCCTRQRLDYDTIDGEVC